MSAQLHGLAPDGSVGYRLVFPTRTPDDVPRLSPPLDATGYQGHYSLNPFQAPYDIRLVDGQTYRVVWIGASREVIPPKPDGTIPGLHFFLTSSVEPVGVEAELASGESRLTHIPTETERLRKTLATALPVLQELMTCLTVLADSVRKVGELRSTPSHSEILADTRAEQTDSQKSNEAEAESRPASHSTSESETATESVLPKETLLEPMGVSLQAASAPESADPPPQQETARCWDAHPMSPEDRQRVIRLALDEDKMTILCRQCFIRTDVGAPSDLPVDSAYVPKAEDAKEMASLETEPVLWAAVSELYLALGQAPVANPTGEYQQPKHIPPLRDFEKQRVRSAFRSSEQRAYFEHLLRHRTAIRLCGEIPPLPKSRGGLNREARRDLEHFFKDSRTSALMTALIQQKWDAEKPAVPRESLLIPSMLALRGRSPFDKTHSNAPSLDRDEPPSSPFT